MKKLALFFIGFIFSYHSFSQQVQTETKIIFEDGKTKQWTIKREYDQQGNLIHSDSSYTENNSDVNSTNPNFYFFQSPDTSFFNQGGYNSSDDIDSLQKHFFEHHNDYMKSFEDFQRDMQEMMKKYQQEFILPDTNFIIPDGMEKDVRRI